MRWLLLLLIPLLVGCERYQKPDDSDRDIGNVRLIGAHLGRPVDRVFEDHDARLLLIRVGNGETRYSLFAWPGVSADRLGSELEHAVSGLPRIGKVTAAEEDLTVAVASERFSYPLAWNWTDKPDVDKVLSGSNLGSGWAAVDVVPGVTARTEGLAPIGGFKKDSVFQVPKGVPVRVTAQESLGANGVIGLAWLFLSPLLLGIGAGLGWIAWRLCRGSLLAYGLVAYPATVAAGVFSFIVMLFASNRIEPATMAWFGGSLQHGDLIIALVFGGVFVSFWVHSYLSPGPTSVFWLILRATGPLFAGMMLPLFYLNMFTQKMPTAFIMLPWMSLLPWVMSGSGRKLSFSQELSSRFRSWTEQARTSPLDVYVVSGFGYGTASLASPGTITANFGRLVVSDATLIRLDPEELDFYFAREASRTTQSLRPSWGPARMFFAGLSVGLLLGFAVVDVQHLWPLFIILFAWMFGFLIRVLSVRGKGALLADEEALELTGDLRSAISSIRKSAQTLGPSIEQRVTHLREVGLRAGLSAD